MLNDRQRIRERTSLDGGHDPSTTFKKYVADNVKSYFSKLGTAILCYSKAYDVKAFLGNKELDSGVENEV